MKEKRKKRVSGEEKRKQNDGQATAEWNVADVFLFSVSPSLSLSFRCFPPRISLKTLKN